MKALILQIVIAAWLGYHLAQHNAPDWAVLLSISLFPACAMIAVMSDKLEKQLRADFTDKIK